MKIKKEMILRMIAGDNILVPAADVVLDLNGLFMLTETGAFIWTLMPQVESEEEIVSKMIEEYDVDKETAQKDVSEFFEKLRSFGIVD